MLIHGLQLNNSAAAASPFGIGSQIFGATTEEEQPVPPEPEFEDDDGDSDTDDSEDSEDTVDEEAEDLAEALAKTTLSDVYAVWKDMPSYPPLYMSTVSEYLPPEPKAKTKMEVDDGLGDGKTKGALEAYENSMSVDEIFSRFTKRVECEGGQCIRYVTVSQSEIRLINSDFHTGTSSEAIPCSTRRMLSFKDCSRPRNRVSPNEPFLLPRCQGARDAAQIVFLSAS